MSEGGVQRAVALARVLLAAKKRVEELETQLDAAKADVRRLEQEDLPDLMMELGLTSFKLEDGSSVEIQNDVVCGISEERRAAAHAWLVANNFGGLIKTEVVARFGKGDRDAAVACAEAIGGELKESVHSATLKSFVKERMAAGQAIPFDLFGVMPFNKVKIALKK